MKLIWKIIAFNTCLLVMTIALLEEVFLESTEIEDKFKESKLLKFLEKKIKE